jgi:hypothetical protein
VSARCAARGTQPCGGLPEIDLRAEGPRAAVPVKARKPVIRERLPSYREPASQNPQAELTRTCKGREPAHRFAFSPPVLRVRRCSRVSSWLAPSVAPVRSCDLPEQKTRDASDRLLPPERRACTRTSRIPGSLAQLSPRATPHGVFGSAWHDRGTGRFHDARARFGGSYRNARFLRFGGFRLVPEAARAWAFSSHGVRCDRASDTPVASPSCLSQWPTFAGAPLASPLGRAGGLEW